MFSTEIATASCCQCGKRRGTSAYKLDGLSKVDVSFCCLRQLYRPTVCLSVIRCGMAVVPSGSNKGTLTLASPALSRGALHLRISRSFLWLVPVPPQRAR